MIHRLIISFILVFRSLGFSEDLQVKMLTKSFADVPVVGRVHHLQTTYLAKNQRNIIQTTSIESGFFSFMAGVFSDVKDTTGTLIDAKGQAWDYNINDKEYWILSDDTETDENSDDEDSKRYEYTISFDSDGQSKDENKIISVSRIGHNEMEDIHGFRTKKWTTTLQFSESKIIIDEWAVNEFSLLRLADSLNREILRSRGAPDSLVAMMRYGSGLSNNEMILGLTKMDSVYNEYDVVPIPGEIIKGDVRMFKDNSDDPHGNFGTEVVELYAENYDEKRFTIPDDYELVD